MTKKKTPTTVKKAAPKNKENKPTWKQTGEAHIPGLDAVTAENQALKTLLSKHQSEPMQQLSKPIERATMLSQFAESMEVQLSRLDNSLTTLDKISNRLVSQKKDSSKPCAPDAHDLSTRLSNVLDYFSQQNDRLDFLNAKLSDLI